MSKYVSKDLPKGEDLKTTTSRLNAEDQKLMKMVKQGRQDPVYFAHELLGVQLHDGQKVWLWMTTRTCLDQAFELGLKLGVFRDRGHFNELLDKLPKFLRNILVPSNRWGKTAVTSVKHLWYNFYKIGVRGSSENIASKECGTLNLSPHSNQCDAGYQYIIDILSSKFVWVLDGKSYKNECKIGWFFVREEKVKRKIYFSNSTSYRAVPTGEDQASSLAGHPYLYISYDECGQSLHLKNELPAKIMSRLIDFGGPLDLVSTPEVDKPSHQYFFHIAKMGLKGDEGWFTMIGKITDNSFLGNDERDQSLASIKATDPAKYRQVAFGEFITTGKKMFDSLVVERLWDRDRPETPLLDHTYVIAVDWGFADNGDPTVFYVLDISLFEKTKRIRIAYHESIRGGEPSPVLARLKILQREWNGAEIVHDASALGGVIIKKLMRELEIRNLFDFQASGTKGAMLLSLVLALTEGRKKEIDAEGRVTDLNTEFGYVRSYYIPELEEQLGNYAFNPDKGVSDRKLEQDHVMALGMGVWYVMKKYDRSNQMKQTGFNPLAPTLETIFSNPDGRQIQMKQVMIEEKRIF